MITATWSDVLAWIADERRYATRRAALDSLEAALNTHGAAATGATAPLPDQLVSRTPWPTPTLGSELASEWDVGKVRSLCLARYGREPVTADGCPGDTQRMLEAYRRAGKVPPPGLRFASAAGAMTPERTMSIVFTDGGLRRVRNALPRTLGGMRDRTLMTGADRHVLIALWAWATRDSGAYSKRVLAFVPLIWPDAPDKAPGLEELHAHLASARR